VDEGIVNHHNDPDGWVVVNIWRDWIAEHLSHLTRREAGDNGSPHSTLLCSHEKGDDCLTVAGFYRALRKGGDAYLPADKVIDEEWWNSEYFHYDEKVVGQRLVALKGHASEIVKPLLDSHLQYAERDNLEYLTCVEAGGRAMGKR